MSSNKQGDHLSQVLDASISSVDKCGLFRISLSSNHVSVYIMTIHQIRQGFILVCVLAGTLAAGSSFAASTLTITDTTYATERAKFAQAERALKKRHFKTYRRLMRELEDYPLYPYLEYHYIRKQLSKTSSKKIQAFMQEQEGSSLERRLRMAWLRHLARNGRWQMFLDNYQTSSSTRMQCLQAYALFKTNRIDAAMNAADLLWQVGRSQPSSCDRMFKLWESHGGKTKQVIWNRIDKSMKKGRTRLARFLAKTLPTEDRRWVNRWVKMHSRPAANLHLKVYRQDKPIARRIVRHGVKRLARRDAGAAADFWDRERERHLIDDEAEIIALDQYIALKAALQKHPRALELLGRLENPSQKIKSWRVRAALNAQDWWAALTWIEALPPEERDSGQWRYWRARILEMQSESLPVMRTASERIYTDLAKERNYHGFLAADRIGEEYDLTSRPVEVTEAELQEMESREGVIRARELLLLNKRVDARREWLHITRDMGDRDLQVAAKLASSWGWHDRAIITVAKGAHYDDLDLRFPMAFKQYIVANAEKRKIDPAWVYGILRQESVFMPDARSHAGALGLMQLMPRTGRVTARQIKTRLRSTRDILQVSKNIQLGTAYLSRMLARNAGHSALATASYNAGPHRVKQWMPESEVPADLWVETIPFKETRNYVRRVMAYTVIYDHRLDGQASKIRQRMPTVQPLSGG